MANVAAHSAQSRPHEQGRLRSSQEATIIYTNYRGETTVRRIQPIRIWFGTSEWHEGSQWFLEAVDLDKAAERSFALSDIRCWLRD